MRTLMIGLLLAATAASPALAGKGGHGGGHGNHGGGHGGGNPHGNAHGGGNPHGRANFQGGGKHGGQAMRVARPAFHGNKGAQWQPAQRVQARPAPAHVARFDAKQTRKQWKRAAKDERKFARQWQRQQRFRPTERVARVEGYSPPRVVRYAPTRAVRYVERPVVRHVPPRAVRYVAAPSVRYVTRNYAPAFYDEPRYAGYDGYAPVQRYYPTSYYAPSDYWPSSYSPIEPAYRSDYGSLFGSGGNGVLGALLPIVLQSVVGGGLGSLGSYGALDSLTGFGAPDVLPLQQASYAPYASGYGSTDLAALLLPSLLGSGSLF